MDGGGPSKAQIAVVAGGLLATTALVAVAFWKNWRANRDIIRFDLLERMVAEAEEGKFTEVQKLLETYKSYKFPKVTEGRTPLHAAAYKGYGAILEILLEAEICNVDSLFGEPTSKLFNITPLLLAAEIGGTECVRMLCVRGADINKAMNTGETPLIGAVVGKKSDTALEILKYNPNVNATLMDGSTALQIALCNQDVELVRALLAVPDIDVNLCRHPEEVQNISPIHNAAELGNLQIVKMLLEKKADFNIQTSEGETPLMCACRTGYVEVVKELLLAGADPNIRAALGTTALHVAVSGKFPEIVRTLLERKVNVDVQRDTDEVKGVSPLHLAAELGDLEITKLLLDAGANINITYESGQTPLLSASWKGHLDVVDELINRGADVNAMVKGGSTSLLISAECQWEKVVESLLKAGAQTTCTLMDNATPLHVAIANTETSLHIIQLLLKYDSDPAFVNAGRNMKEGPHNVTALHVAAEVGSVAIAKELLAAGADLEAEFNNGQTPFLSACNSGNVDVARALLEAGANKKASLKSGTGAMHLAVASKNLQLVKELIAAGVNVSATNAQKETPLHYAYAFRQLAIVRELEKAGADKNAQDARGVKCEDVEWEVDK